MNKTILGVIITVLAIGGVVGVVALNNKDSGSNSNEHAGSMKKDNATESSNPFTQNNDKSTTEVQSGEVAMDIKDFAFAQKTLKVKKGTTVTWTNQDSAKHDITPNEESEVFKGSKLLAKGESYSFTFNTVGTYNYICSPHPYMKGIVEVSE